MWNNKFSIYITLNGTDTAVDIPHNDNTTVGTWIGGTTRARLDTSFLRDEWMFYKGIRKNSTGNKNVDKKVKRVGWSPQFFEK